MPRQFPSVDIQAHSKRLRNEICRLATPVQMAEVSSHLRNFAVAEVIGFIAMLDGHPGIVGQPTIQKSGAGFQQTKGTVLNPLAHAIPSNMLLSGDNLANFYNSAGARDALHRVFGMGVMAPDDWEKVAFPHPPRENNIVDAIAERHHYGGGLVAAFEDCAEAAIQGGLWDGAGRRKHNLESLTDFIRIIYTSTWVPRARTAYLAARVHLTNQIDAARSSNSLRLGVLELRRNILGAQISVFERETTISPEAARNVWKFAAAEIWN